MSYEQKTGVWAWEKFTKFDFDWICTASLRVSINKKAINKKASIKIADKVSVLKKIPNLMLNRSSCPR